LRVVVIDIGTNSTRLLVADVAADGSGLRELVRDSRVTRLGRGVDTSGQLSAEAIEDVCAAISDYLEIAAEHDPEQTIALATSAVRDASNGDAFLAELRERFALSGRVIDGLEEARLTFGGATCGRPSRERTLVCDIGGGSTELIVGSDGEPAFHESLQLGVVRHSERFLSGDPPASAELEALADSARAELTACRGRLEGPSPAHGIAVAGTATSLAAIELDLEPYDASSVEGHILGIEALQHQLARLASMPLAERRQVRGLQPDRAPTIVSGVVILISMMRVFGLDRVEVSEQDILWGAALAAAAPPDSEPR
jgi:exopolyphosphatase / guanosine-5'-triphosphate,3'-diphosphate pyrophosphatase